MLPRVAAAALLPVLLVVATLTARAQTPDPNLQNLLTGLVNGTEVMLVTPLATGQFQVTSLNPGGRLSAPDAAAAIDRARAQLQQLGEPNPTAEEIARVLAGGPINTPAGRVQAAGILPASGHPASIRSQVVAAGTPLPGAAPGTSSAGGSAPVNARDQAIRELAQLGIINPSEDQIRTALVGGPLNTVNGVVQLPGILPR
jgi:hypothetical protein